MTEIPIYNTMGLQVDSLAIKDKIEFVSGRVSKGARSYYKGVGAPYSRQYGVGTPIDAKHVKNSGIFYAPIVFQYEALKGKFGIFQTRFQSFYPDWVGSCGSKEGKIVMNSIEFERSSVDVHDYVIFANKDDPENQQAFVELDYKCNRRRFLDSPDNEVRVIGGLIEYMITEDWNFTWDKNSIGDITDKGMVADPADLFKSSNVVHQFGTIYSILYSLYVNGNNKYVEFVKVCGLNNRNLSDVVYNTAHILSAYGYDMRDTETMSYGDIIKKYLLTGRNCVHCACNMWQNDGDSVMNQYLEQFKG